MKKLGAKGMKNLRLVHIIFAMIWTVSVLAMVALTQLMKPNTGDELYMKFVALLIIDDWMVIVSAITTVVLGIVYGVFTNWGFFKHKWIIVKWILSMILVTYGTFWFHPWLTRNIELTDEIRDAAFSNIEIQTNNLYMEVSGYIQITILLFMVVISVYKPWKKKKQKA